MLVTRSHSARSASLFRGTEVTRGRVGAPAGLRRGALCLATEMQARLVCRAGREAKPPVSGEHRLRKLRGRVRECLALAATAAYNRSVEVDAQGRPRLRRSYSMGATHLQRYVALANCR